MNRPFAKGVKVATLFFTVALLPTTLSFAQSKSGPEEAMLAADDRNRILSPRDMTQIADAIGARCTHCHTPKKPDGKPDYAANSPMKDTAKYMKTHFVDGLVTLDGRPVTCATCHAGKTAFLPDELAPGAQRSSVQGDRMEIMRRMNGIAKALGVRCDFCHTQNPDGRLAYELPTARKQVAKYMMTEFVGKLKLKNGSELTCATCHAGRAEFLPHRTAGEEGAGHEGHSHGTGKKAGGTGKTGN